MSGRWRSQGKGPEAGLALIVKGRARRSPRVWSRVNERERGAWRTPLLRGQWAAMEDWEQGRFLT